MLHRGNESTPRAVRHMVDLVMGVGIRAIGYVAFVSWRTCTAGWTETPRPYRHWYNLSHSTSAPNGKLEPPQSEKRGLHWPQDCLYYCKLVLTDMGILSEELVCADKVSMEYGPSFITPSGASCCANSRMNYLASFSSLIRLTSVAGRTLADTANSIAKKPKASRNALILRSIIWAC